MKLLALETSVILSFYLSQLAAAKDVCINKAFGVTLTEINTPNIPPVTWSVYSTRCQKRTDTPLKLDTYDPAKINDLSVCQVPGVICPGGPSEISPKTFKFTFEGQARDCEEPETTGIPESCPIPNIEADKPSTSNAYIHWCCV